MTICRRHKYRAASAGYHGVRTPRSPDALRRVESGENLVVPADHAYTDAFDGEAVAAQVDLDRLVVGVFGQQLHAVAFGSVGQAFDGDFVVEAGHDDVAVSSLGCFVDSKQVAFEDADVDHAVTFNGEQVVSAWVEHGRRDADVFVDALF